MSVDEITKQRFLDKVRKTRGCWLWVGAKQNKGYGMFPTGKKYCGSNLAHRFSFSVHNGPIPRGLEIAHKCDTPACVRPDHLFLATRSQNMLDAAKKLRLNIGEGNGNSTLTLKSVGRIRGLYAEGASIPELSRMFTADRETIRDIIRLRTWVRHLGLLPSRERFRIKAV